MTANPVAQFQQQVLDNIRGLASDKRLREATLAWIDAVAPFQYAYNFTWLGRPIIQTPQDIVALQEIIWKIQPDVIVETGIAHGGSLIFYASMLQLLGRGSVIGVDIEIRPHNRLAIEQNPLAKRIELIEGSSTSDAVIGEVFRRCRSAHCVMVVLDSNHIHDHVLAELRLYSPLVQPGSYIVVFDTLIEDLPDTLNANRPWGKGNNPKTAVHQFLRESDRFEIDRNIADKLVITAAPDGFLRCVKPFVG